MGIPRQRRKLRAMASVSSFRWTGWVASAPAIELRLPSLQAVALE
jgi:hypothetical protein